MSQCVPRIGTNLEPCIALLSYEKVTGLRVVEVSICKIFSRDQPWLIRKSGETGCAAQKSHSHCSIAALISSTDISTNRAASQTLQTWEL